MNKNVNAKNPSHPFGTLSHHYHLPFIISSSTQWRRRICMRWYRKNPWPKIDERNVEVLNANNFSDFIVKNQHVIVMFYGQWYTWCQKVAPESAAAAKQLKVWWRLQILMLIRRKSCRKSMKFQGILHFIYLLMDYLVWKILHQPGEFLLSLLFDSWEESWQWIGCFKGVAVEVFNVDSMLLNP